MAKIRFCKHAEAKFEVLKQHGFSVSRKQVLETVKNPEKLEKGYGGRLISQKAIGEEHVLRVVHEKIDGKLIIVTFYPGRREYYEN